MSKNKIIYLLATIPILDAVLPQVQNLLGLGFGGMSLLQVVHGGIMACAIIYLLFQKDLLREDMRLVLGVAVYFAGVLLIAAIKEIVTTDTLSRESLVDLCKILYWLAMWCVIKLRCRTRHDATIVLYAIMIEAGIIAASVIYGFLTGWGLSNYDYQQVSDATGGFLTGKYLCGPLLVGALIAFYYGQQRKNWFYVPLVLACLGAMLMTYARAAQVAAAAVVTWLLMWRMRWLSRSGGKSWILRFGAPVLLLIVIGIVYVGPGDFLARWSDISNPYQAGSGRATFWKTSLEIYAESGVVDQLLGKGPKLMKDTIGDNHYIRIHTHNDFLDALLVGGVLGAAGLVAVWAAMFENFRKLDRKSIEAAIALSIFLVFLCQGIFTGQIFGMVSMLSYVYGSTCFRVLGQVKPAVAPQSFAPVAARQRRTVVEYAG